MSCLINRLNADVLSEIAAFSGNVTLLFLLRLQDKIRHTRINNKDSLIFGHVQSGKTREIINVIMRPSLCNFLKVLVIQNSVLALNQYIQTFKRENIRFYAVTSSAKKSNRDISEVNVILVMNNSYRYREFTRLNVQRDFILLIDEYDMCIKNMKNNKNNNILTHPYLKKQVHITATPNPKTRYDVDQVMMIPKAENYFGIEKFKFEVANGIRTVVKKFMDDTTSETGGILLITRYTLIRDMITNAHKMSKKFRDIPFVVMSVNKVLFINGKSKILSQKTINKIIDHLHSHSRIIFISNRLASRCYNYSSSDFSRHLTHQAIQVKENYTTVALTSFIQKMRLCGIYNDNPTLTLFVTQLCRVNIEILMDKYKCLIQINADTNADTDADAHANFND
jgi:hypothetical protein